MYSLVGNVGGRWFNGIDNDDVLKFTMETYHVTATPQMVEYRGTFIVIADSGDLSASVIHNDRTITQADVYRDDEKPNFPRAKYRSRGRPISAADLKKRKFLELVEDNLIALNELKKKADVVSMVNMLGNPSVINWHEFGVLSSSQLAYDVKAYYRALGFKVKGSCSSHECNERSFIEIDDVYVANLEKYA
ncbi:hypothetical protein MYOV003v1_p0014 [Vibrio phage 207E48.1]|nr:hypothetical protein MYOV003v1_p0014 [Vibrio phage 207E48.1]